MLMRFRLKFANWRLGVILTKTRYAYGLSSKLKNGKHLLLIDVDSVNWHDLRIVQDFLNNNSLYPYFTVRTPHGWHLVVWRQFYFDEVSNYLSILESSGVIDSKFVSIGRHRGYWFLESQYESYVPMNMDNVQFMRIERTA